jgi:hypothetical protein
LEKVSVIGVLGRIPVPGVGLATALAADPDGNQLTITALEVSHVRGAAATMIVPASALRGRAIVLVGAPRTWRRTAPGGP